MKKYLLIATGAAMLAGGGVALAQTPPPSGPDGGPDRHEHWGERGAMMYRGHMRGDGAAFFRFRRGDAEMDIKCPAGENVQACVAAAGSLMDKVGGMQPKAQ